MVRNYKRKTGRSTIDENAIRNAMNDVKKGKESKSTAAKKYGINRTTLLHRLKKLDPLKSRSEDEDITENERKYQSKYSSRQIFTKTQEDQLCEYIKKCAFSFYGMSYQTLRRFVYDYAIANNIKISSSWKERKEATMDWVYSFLKRNPTLSLRKPENTTLARMSGFNKTAVDLFYNNLKSLYEQYSFLPIDIYNLDETGISTVLEPPKVLAEKGQRSVSQASSAERGSLVTLVGTISAAGNHLPPVFIFTRARLNERFLNGCLPGSLALVSKTGWMMSELFVDVLQHIQLNTKCSKERPILILLDNHSSHCSLQSIEFCRENGIVLLSFPPHTSHRLQPLDVTIFGPFKKLCRAAFNDYLVGNVGKAISIFDVTKLTNQPFQRAFSSENILKGFTTTGIYPFNSENFADYHFSLENDEDTLPAVDGVISGPDILITEYKTESLTPEMVRPIPRICASKKTARSGMSRIITSSPEKQRVKDIVHAKKIADLKKKKKLSFKRGVRQVKKQMKGKEEHQASSDSSAETINYAESKQSLGSFAKNDGDDDGNNDLEKYKVLEDDNLEKGDFVLVKFGGDSKKPFFYIGEIEHVFNDHSYNINYLRRATSSSWVFVKPHVEDVALTLRSDIELKLPQPTNPASTSRCRAKYCFNINLENYYIK